MQLDQIVKFFAKFIEKELGIIYSEHNAFQLQNRLEEISTLLNIPNIEKLYEEAQKGIQGQFRELLLDHATNNETSFFRDNRIFNAIETIVLKPAVENKQEVPIKIWSAASSSGQEAISMAILINEFNIKQNANLKFSILGTDISERILVKAKSATYSQLEVQRGLPAPLLAKYFAKNEKENWTVHSDITKFIEYKKLNLKDPFPRSDQFNLILCRNVLIYQNVEGKIEILKKITSELIPGGYLVLGSGESILGLSNDYESQSVDGVIVYRKKDPLAQAA